MYIKRHLETTIDQAGGFPSEHARSVGVYFPQLFGGDGCWDMRLELSDTNNWWYGHWYLVNGWTYKDDILGDAMGKNTRKYYGSISHYLANGDRIDPVSDLYLASELKRGDTILTRTDEAGKIYFDKEEAHKEEALVAAGEERP